MNTPDENFLVEFVNLCNRYPAEPRITFWTHVLAEQQQPTILDIPAHLDQAARAISARLFPDHWAGWVVYLLEALQDHASDDAYRDMLLELSSAIETRLLEEQW